MSATCDVLKSPFVFSFAGDSSQWLITTWEQISNNGAAYGDSSPRRILKSSDSPFSCTHELASIPNGVLIFGIVAVNRRWRNNNRVGAEPLISLYV